MDVYRAVEIEAKRLPLARSSYSPSLDETGWSVGDRCYSGAVKVVVRYRCGGDGRSFVGCFASSDAAIAAREVIDDVMRQMQEN